MSSKRGYLVHFARIFFASLLLLACSSLTHVWNAYQPLHLAFQIQQCQLGLSNRKDLSANIWPWLTSFQLSKILPTFSFLSTSSSSKCLSHSELTYPLNVHQYIEWVRSVIAVYLVYHLVCLFLFHAQMKRLEEKQRYYGRRYRQEEKVRCSKRLLKT
ncbi:unnamed protein product [Adineta ricciae]|uniref:Uncharacterized protein n=1 Tax=Adineta ricciae TaxID=249248 RepID=A0A813WTJ1_ADIRI|nr:unnamed protein product [Adineta ricciae]CAF0923556.1 unnamed protein product [Adineta ricciae]